MAQISAKDIQNLRQLAGVGMMEAKRALEAADGDVDAALKALREQGLAKSAERSDRDNSQGAVAIGTAPGATAIVQVKSETDFVAKSPEFVAFVQALADTVAAKGEAGVADHQATFDQLKISLKENIDLGRIVRFETAANAVVDTYLHVQSGRGVNATMVEVVGGSQELAHDIALHIAFARPKYLSRDEVPADVIAAERDTLEQITRNEGKPEAALPKIVEGRLGGFFKSICLVEQEFAKDNKQTISGVLANASISRFAQVEIG
jgi:elongation factor Ts